MYIHATAPTRIDLAGGTLDLWPIHQILAQKATVNVAVTLPAQIEIRTHSQFSIVSEDQNVRMAGSFDEVCQGTKLPLLSYLLAAIWNHDLPPIEIKTKAKSPAGAGLGGSSCLAIALTGALFAAKRALGAEKKEHTERYLVALAQDIEARVIHAPTGVQDYWGAVRGGLNLIEFPPGKIEVTTYAANHLSSLNDRLLLCYSGKSRASALNNWQIFKRVFDGDQSFKARLEKIGKAAVACGQAIARGDIENGLKASYEEWQLRKDLWPDITTGETQRIDQAACRAGADFTRVCGAGGGGVMTIFCQKGNREKVSQAIASAGGQILDAVIAEKGLTVKDHG